MMKCALIVILLLSTPAFAQHPYIKPDLEWPVAVAIVGTAADLGTTQAAIHSGRFAEGNPFLGQQPAVRIGVSSALTIGLIIGSAKLHATHPRLARWILFGYGIARGVIATTTVLRIARQ